MELIHDIVPLVRKCNSARKILRVSKGSRLNRPRGGEREREGGSRGGEGREEVE
jgi:hypothetical protein